MKIIRLVYKCLQLLFFVSYFFKFFVFLLYLNSELIAILTLLF